MCSKRLRWRPAYVYRLYAFMKVYICFKCFWSVNFLIFSHHIGALFSPIFWICQIVLCWHHFEVCFAACEPHRRHRAVEFSIHPHQRPKAENTHNEKRISKDQNFCFFIASAFFQELLQTRKRDVFMDLSFVFTQFLRPVTKAIGCVSTT